MGDDELIAMSCEQDEKEKLLDHIYLPISSALVCSACNFLIQRDITDSLINAAYEKGWRVINGEMKFPGRVTNGKVKCPECVSRGVEG